MSNPVVAQPVFINPLLAKLREFNPAIGTYESCSMLHNFNYLIKLSNGEIIICSTLVATFLQKPTSVSNDTYQNVALQFLAKGDDRENFNNVKHNNRILVLLFVLLLLIIMVSTYLPNHQ